MTKQDIIQALTLVRYPGTGKSIAEQGMLMDDLKIDGNRVSFSLFFDKPNDPFVKSIVKSAERTILAFAAADSDIQVDITVKTPEIQQREAQNFLPDVKNVIAIFSGKGGVGKSTVAVNLAVALSRMGFKVGLLDADIYGPSLPKMFGVENHDLHTETYNGLPKIIPVEKFGVKMLSIGLMVDTEKALIWRGTLAGNALKQLITDAAWGTLDFFIIDLPPGTGDIQLTLIQNLKIDGAIAVTTPQDVALADARKGINMFKNEKVGVRVLGIVENMSWFTPAELPDNKYFIFGKDGGNLLAEDMNITLLAQIPLVESIRAGCDNGSPIAAENSTVAKHFENLAAKVIESI
ncbi:MAG: Mrp/NBP35 family ATP-binding protein [Prevotellaceae bacterium]|jgi:ATP-binding protein involved in chromosome partitioning|nr:Mrp/NBP35 family ATP-binding protein [Prevotellaceae bacterium]